MRKWEGVRKLSLRLTCDSVDLYGFPCIILVREARALGKLARRDQVAGWLPIVIQQLEGHAAEVGAD